MKKRKVCIIGRIAPGVELYDGQTVKTRLLYDQLKTKTDWDIRVVDTYNKKKKIRLFFRSIHCLFKCKDVFICLSSNGIGVYFKMLNFFMKVRKNRVYHYIVGGNHHKYLVEHPKYIKISKKFAVNWAQTNNLVEELRKLGIENAKYMPNFKPIEPVDISKSIIYEKAPFKFVMFSRITKTKGIDIASETVERINNEYGKTVCTLDVFGVVEDSFEEEFSNILKNNPFVKYNGAKNPFESGEVLKDYYVLLFPTHWDGEGFAATILDAYFGGIPVIATDWNCNAEIVNNGKTGFIYPNEQFKDLYECVKYAIENPDKMNAMKQNCVDFAKEYTPNKYIDEIVNFVESK